MIYLITNVYAMNQFNKLKTIHQTSQVVYQLARDLAGVETLAGFRECVRQGLVWAVHWEHSNTHTNRFAARTHLALLPEDVADLPFHKLASLLYRDEIQVKHTNRERLAQEINTKKQPEIKTRQALQLGSDDPAATPNLMIRIILEHLVTATEIALCCWPECIWYAFLNKLCVSGQWVFVWKTSFSLSSCSLPGIFSGISAWPFIGVFDWRTKRTRASTTLFGTWSIRLLALPKSMVIDSTYGFCFFSM